MSELSPDLIDRLADARDPAAREAILTTGAVSPSAETVAALAAEVVVRARRDLAQAERLAAATSWLAARAGDRYSLAVGAKTEGHLHYLNGRYEVALESYRECQRLFEAAGAELEAAMNRASGSLQVLILLGRYADALAALERARPVLEKRGTRLQRARLVANEGNIHFRQDRFEQALELYQRSLEELREIGETQDVAVALANVAVTRVALADSAGALAVYEELVEFCRRHELPPVAVQAEYNRAYLLFQRGEYREAIEVYQITREHCDEVGDPYHRALCDLDQGEIYLELNLERESERLLRDALASFERLGLGYESAKALAFLAVAAFQRGDEAKALELFERARRAFDSEHNEAWIAMVDYYRGLVLCEAGRLDESEPLATRAFEFFRGRERANNATVCELLVARVRRLRGDLASAREHCGAALERIAELELPALDYRVRFELGQVEEAAGNEEAALASYRRAERAVEDLRDHLGGEDTRLGFLKGKTEVYERLVSLMLRSEHASELAEEAFGYIEKAKSRILADLIASRASSLGAAAGGPRDLVERLRRQREELNAHYRRIHIAELAWPPAGGGAERNGSLLAVPEHPPQLAPPRMEELRQRSRRLEAELQQTLSELRAVDPELASLKSAGTLELAEIQASLGSGTTLLEFYEARGSLYACVLNGDSLEVRAVAHSGDLTRELQLLRFQMSKFRLGAEHMKRSAGASLAQTRQILGRLYAKLIAPIERRLSGEQLVVVPHGRLHQVPLHALRDGDEDLVDRFKLAYAPSASVFAMCRSRGAAPGRGSLVFGVPDEKAPRILDEAREIAEILPDCRLFVGEEATEARLREHGPGSRFIHLATHGVFRSDNPMFSAIQLGDSRLTLLDLYELELGAELIVLSGCGTGLAVVENGDELIGLTRGLLHAGAASVLATLWDVNDESTAHFMRSFYLGVQAGENRAGACRSAMLALRATHPHPYFWAPFVLTGCSG